MNNTNFKMNREMQFIESQNITGNIVKQTIKKKIIQIINNNIEDYNFKQDIIDEIETCSNHIFKNADIKQLEENYKEIFIDDLTIYFYEKCIEKLMIPNINLIADLNENENENLYIIINNNICNNNIQYGIISEYEDPTIIYETFSESELKKFQNTFDQDEFIILTYNIFIFVIKMDFIEEELLNSCNLYLK